MTIERGGGVDGPVIGAIITASVALVVSVGGAVRGMVAAAVDRRYERRRAFLIQAQDAMLVLREAVARYGAALRDDMAVPGDPNLVVADLPGASTASMSYVVAVPKAVDLDVATARGRLDVARSRLEDEVVADALERWAVLAQASLIDSMDVQTAAEQAAFDEVNGLIRIALRSMRARVGRRSRPERQRTAPVGDS